MRRRLLVIWAYASEFILSSATLLLLVLIFDISQIETFMRMTAADFSTYFGATMLAASLAFLWTFYSKADSEFMAWLHERRAFSVYLGAFRFSILIYIAMLIAITATKHTSNTAIALIAAWISLLGLAASYSLIKNVSDLMKLNVLFNQKKKNL